MVGSAATVVIFDVADAMEFCNIFQDGLESGDFSATRRGAIAPRAARSV